MNGFRQILKRRQIKAVKYRSCSLVAICGLLLCMQASFAREIYKCTTSGVTTFQGVPCKDKKTQKVACVNYAMESDFKKSLEDECPDNGANDGGYGGYYSSYSGSSSSSYSSGSSSSSYSSSRTKNQHVSGYTRKDGTYVKPYTRSKK